MNTNTTTSKTDSNKTDSKTAAFGADTGLQEKIMKQLAEIGDSLERAGEKVEKSGWETIGQAIYKLGNTLEHLKDKKSTAASTTAAPYSDKEFDEKSKESKSKNFTDSKASATKVGGSDSQAY